MRKKKTIWKKTMSVVLSLVMAAVMFPVVGKPLTVEAEEDDSSNSWAVAKPSVNYFATKDELIDKYNLTYDSGIARKVNFGRAADKSNLEWYIAGYDYKDKKLVLWCNPHKPLGNTLFAKDEYTNVLYLESELGHSILGGYEGTVPSKVCKNHYGSSNLRVFLQEFAENEQYFSQTEQNLMATTKVYTGVKDSGDPNNTIYYTEDKLYPAIGVYDYTTGYYNNVCLWVGANSSASLESGVRINPSKALNGWCSSIWLRNPSTYYSKNVYAATSASTSTNGSYLYYFNLDTGSSSYSMTADSSYANNAVVPAFALDPTSVLFASDASVYTNGEDGNWETFNYSSYSGNMALRMEDSNNYIHSNVSNTADTITVEKDFDRGDLYLYVQGYDYRDEEFVISKKITESGEFRLGDLVYYFEGDDVDISNCRIWIETTYDNVTYAKLSQDVSKPTVSVPTANIEPGLYESGQKLELYTETDGAQIYYTTDGSTPDMWNTAATKLYKEPILLTETTTVKAYAVKYGMANSEVKLFSYKINPHVHNWSTSWTSDSSGHWHECSAASCTVTANNQKDGYAAHTADSGTVTTQPTATSTGVKTYKCSVCGYVMRTETLPATGGGTTSGDAGTTGGGTTSGDAGTTGGGAASGDADKIASGLDVSLDTAEKVQTVAKDLSVSTDTLLITDKTVTAQKTDSEITGSSFAKIQARASKTTSKSVKLTWNRVKGADGYLVYGNRCNSGGKRYSYKLIKTISKGSTKSYTQSKLKKGTFYKYMVCAYKLVDGKKITIAASKTIHVTTAGGKYGNAKTIKLNKTKVSLKKGKTVRITATQVKQSKKLKKHRSVCYESSNTKVATVSGKGLIKAKAKGSCTIYVYAQNGIYKTVKVTVK